MFRNRTFKAKLVLAFSLISLCLVAVGGMNYWALRSVSSQYDHVATINLGNAITLSDMQKYADDTRAILNRFVDTVVDLKVVAKLSTQYAHNKEQYAINDKTYTEIPFVDGEDALYRPMDSAWKKYKAATDQMFEAAKDLSSASQSRLQKILATEALPAAEEFTKTSEVLINFQKSESTRWTALAQSTSTRVAWISLVLVVVGALASMTLGLFLANSLTRSISRIINDLDAASKQTLGASSQVSASSQALAQGATEQAASVEETSASLEEIAGMTRQNSEHAANVEDLARKTQDTTRRGGEAMTRMEAAIQSIKEGSDKTAKIIKTIDEIAFQTNLLALNAAVEAARAGDAGRGFAVVAEEVRSLAIRSAEAAKNTSQLIDDSQQRAAQGVTVAGEVGALLRDIADTASRMNTLVGEVSSASKEQHKGVQQITQAMGQMDQATQSNAATAEETSAAAEELSAQAESLAGIVRELNRIMNGGQNTDLIGIARNGGNGHAIEHLDLSPRTAPVAIHAGNGIGKKPASLRGAIEQGWKDIAPEAGAMVPSTSHGRPSANS